MQELAYCGVNAVLEKLNTGETSAAELLTGILERIESHNPRLGALTATTEQQARRDAAQADAQRHRGEAVGPLAGLPVTIKEIIDTTPAPCSAGLPFLRDYRPGRDAEVVKRLREAGAVVMGVAASDPGAFGVRTDAVIHPQAPDRSVGGSSGGSAAALAAGFGYASLGTDTGGSVRIPAACCLTASLKPTYGRVPSDGVRPLSWSLDHVGTMTRRAADIAPLQRVLDPGFESTRSPMSPARARVGVDPDYFSDADAAVRDAMDEVLDACRAMGCTVVPVRLPAPAETAGAHGTILLSEAAAYYEQAGLADHPGLPELPRSNIDAARGFSAIRYVQAARKRHLMREQVRAILKEQADLLIVPTLPVLTPLRSDKAVTIAGRVHDYTMALVRYTSLFNHTGNPVVAMPANILGPGTGIGVQIVAGHDRDADAVAFATRLEAELGLSIDWRIRD